MHRELCTIIAAASLITIAATPSRASDLQDQVDQATAIIERFREMPEQGLPESVLRDAKGLAILTVLKAGFMFSGQGGWGVVIARTPNGWSAPSAIGTGGAGFGFQVGGKVTEFVLVLNTPEAVDAFSRGGNVSFGGALSAAAGPLGRTAGASIMPIAAVYTYSRSQGLFAGVSIEGTIIAARDDANRAYYGRDVTPKELLAGEVKPPRGVAKLHDALGKATVASGPRAAVDRDGRTMPASGAYLASQQGSSSYFLLGGLEADWDRSVLRLFCGPAVGRWAGTWSRATPIRLSAM